MLLGFAVLATALGTGLPAARAADHTPTYWNLSNDGQKPTCRAIVSRASELEKYFESRHKQACSTQDKGDHRVVECGDVRELVAFSRESCLSRGDEPQTDNQKRTLAAFNVCMAPAKGSFTLDDSILYCSCMSKNVLRFSDQELGGMSRAENEKMARQCVIDSGAVFAAAAPSRKVEPPKPKPEPPESRPEPRDESVAAGRGTCFAVSRDGLVVTALHVVDGAQQINVRFVGGAWIPASLERADLERDVAVLRVRAQPRSWLSLVSARQATLGQHVFTVGFPVPRTREEDAEFAEGAIRAFSERGKVSLLQISAPIQPGNSGGPLVTETGDVVGIVDHGLAAAQDAVAYAVRSDFALQLLPEMPRQEAAKNRQVAIQRAVSAVCAVRTTR